MELKPPRARSESLRSRFPRIRSSHKIPSLEKPVNESMRLFKPNMMIPEREDEESTVHNDLPAVKTDQSSKYLIFRQIFLAERPPVPPNTGYYFKFLGAEVKLIRWVFEDNGFRENKNNWLIGWSNVPMRSTVYQTLTPFQKVNHFPRTHEITKKDNLFKNISKMQSLYGKRHYNFIPETYVLPNDFMLLSEEIEKQKDLLWIVKPAGSSQGKGIFLTNKINEIPPGQAMVASRYISNPLLINDLKFDLRIYIAVTSMDPLRIYIYKEGMARFATEPYDLKNPRNRFVHLTNYSLNKYAPGYKDLNQDGKGFKWTLTALKQFLESQGVNFQAIWEGIKDIAVKTIISIETIINSAMSMYVPSSKNCFELLGFDILIDENLRPWLLEVNLSPSMNTDTGIDLKIKSSLISDLFNLIGIRKAAPKKRKNSCSSKPAWTSTNAASGLNKKELRVVLETQFERERIGNFECCFPIENSLQYKQFLDVDRPFNNLLMAHFTSVKKDIYRNQLQEYDNKLEILKKTFRKNETPIKNPESYRNRINNINN
jgi:tubulin polyglutamylase TTLL5